MPGRRSPADRLCLPRSAWPAVDGELWDAALQPETIFETGGARGTHRAKSNEKVVKGYGRWLSWLRQAGRLDPHQLPAQRITREAVLAYLHGLSQANAPITQWTRLLELYGAARALAPECEWGWIRRLAARIRHRPSAVLKQRLGPASSRDLLHLGLELMATADAETTARKAAMQYRDGLIIAFLAHCPVRRVNLATLRLGDHLVQQGGAWWVLIPGGETKTGQPIEFAWPDRLVSALETYLHVHRPELARQRKRWAREVGEALWVSGDGSPLGYERLYSLTKKRTLAAFGRGVSPHQFRHGAATLIAIEDPIHVGIVMPLLGHRNASTSERYYNLARSVGAAHRHQSMVTSLRAGTLLWPDADADAVPRSERVPTPAARPMQASITTAEEQNKTQVPALDPRRLGDLTGQVFGGLVALRPGARTAKGRPRWHVRCRDCGAEQDMRRDALVSIQSPPSGCSSCEDLDRLKAALITGQAIGGGCVESYAGRDRHAQHNWVCRCRCGARSTRSTSNLHKAIGNGSIACRSCAHRHQRGTQPDLF